MADARSLLAYGAANLGNLHREISDIEAREILETAWDVGIRSFDTAPHYGMGLSERRLGEFLRDKPRDQFVLSTKVGRLIRPNPDDDGGLDLDNGFHVRSTTKRVWDFSPRGIEVSLDESLERMGLDRMDTLYLHDPERHDLDLALSDALPALQSMRAAGRVTSIGVGSMSTDALTRVVRDVEVDVLMVAGRYTLLEQPAAAELLPACRATGTGVVAASVFNSGLLASRTPRADARYEYGSVPDPIWDRLVRIVAICGSYGVPLPAAALAFLARDPLVTSIVVGASRPAQLSQNAALLDEEIPEAFWQHLAEERLIA